VSNADDLVSIYWPRDHLEAHAIKEALVAVGIFCHIDGENLAALSGGGWLSGIGRCRMRIMVTAADRQRAQAIIRDNGWPSFGFQESEES
jgi:hypothetical protein